MTRQESIKAKNLTKLAEKTAIKLKKVAIPVALDIKDLAALMAVKLVESNKVNQDKHTKEVVDVVGKMIDSKINGELVDIKATQATQGKAQATQGKAIEDISEHLDKQDSALEDLSAKIKPFDVAKRWGGETWALGIKLGGGAIALIAIIKFCQLVGFIK